MVSIGAPVCCRRFGVGIGLVVALAFLQLGFSAAPARAQVQVKPWFMIVVDTSGSMQDNCTNGATNWPTCNNCGGGCASTANSCGLSHTRINDAKCALRNILNSTGDAEFGLMQFRHPCRASCDSRNGGDASQTCDADVRVGISTSNYSLLTWVDGSCTSNCSSGNYTQELYAYGYTPIGQSLVRSREYFAASTSPTATDTYAGCRPVAVIMLTDGQENCGGSGTTAATSLRTTVVPSPGNTTKTIDIKTYAVGFGLNPGDTNIEALAMAGGTDAPGQYRGFYAQNEEALSAALNQIITNSQLTERCDGRDNDCDTRVDEDNPKYCDVRGIRTANPQVPNPTNPTVTVDQSTIDPRVPACSGGTCPAVTGVAGNTNCAAPEYTLSEMCSPRNVLCTSPGERCNTLDDDCDGRADEGAPAIAESNEVCGDNLDNDCDLLTDEDCNGCISQPEICDNADQDCDGRSDEGLSRSCGTMVGRCTPGTQTCTAGIWSTCSGNNAIAEECNNIDDDCDGVVDGISRPCGMSNLGTCRFGSQICTTGNWGTCVGNIDPSSDVCDTLDNDCNASTPDGAMDPRVGQPCGVNRGVCMLGTTACQAGEIRCVGATTGSSELCDGLDNDCDGNVDEGVAASDMRVNQPCINPGGNLMYGPVMVSGQCRTGTTVCSNGMLACPGYVGPVPEICDSLDQDCDGSFDEGVMMSDPRVGQSCGTSLGECEPGVRVCVNGMLQCNADLPGTEVCNSLDDDCDGLIDENLPASPTACGNPMVGECRPGLEACIGGQIVCAGEIRNSPEICDNKDNDCDGSTDENNPGGNQPCGLDYGECNPGTTQCINGTLSCEGDDAPSTEICDGLDNDCDNLTDEGNPGGGARCDEDASGTPILGTCRTRVDPADENQALTEACGECRFGTEVCVDAEIVCVGAVGPKPEICDGLDNDCDSPCVVDNSDPQNPALRCPVDRCDLPESDPDHLDCDGKIDEEVATTDPNVGVPCSGGSGECREGTSQCIGGVVSCIGGQIPVNEVCNEKDDDCDTVIDEGFMTGTACGSDVGECEQGTIRCDLNAGTSFCDGEVQPTTEVCDGLDNDCDGVVDNGNPGGGVACGKDDGECQAGTLVCSGGRLICNGEKTASPEICDCLDNDCDGTVDENPGADSAICPGESACVMCQCAQLCRDAGEFAQTCPAGKVPLSVDNECRCVGERCRFETCAAQTIEQGGVTLCAPDLEGIGACVCKDNECAPLCSGVVCDGELVCDPKDGLCKEKSCLLAQFACAEGEFCNVVTQACEADSCTGFECGADQGCRDGACFASCANVSCEAGQACSGGQCVENKCANTVCAGLQVCNPDNGECVAAGSCLSFACKQGFLCNAVSGECSPDPCLRTTCPRSQVCREGECQLRCALPQIDCDGTCINPQTSREFCGATADCLGDNDGTTCSGRQVCSEGSCSDTCQAGFIACGGGCVNPLTDEMHCGASGDCSLSRAGVQCTAGYRCMAGECVQEVQADAGSSEERPKRRVSLSGGGGCACEIAQQPPADPDFRFLLALSGWVVLFWRRRMKQVFGAALRLPLWKSRGALARLLLVLCLAFAALGCKVNTFCLDCDDGTGGRGGRSGLPGTDNPEGGVTGGVGGDGQGGEGGESGEGGEGGELPDAQVGDGGLGDGSVECTALEACNGRDDDCDGNTDEGTDPASENIDLETDLENCGACGRRCALDHAFSRCTAGECRIDSCDPEFLDFDENDANGCEYRCRKTADDDTLCNRRDDDCDTEVDEDVEFSSDLNNCGSCNNACRPANATSGGLCDEGTCELDPTKCNAGFVDVDGVYANGCEYQCMLRNGGVEQCNGLDDDCDKRTDEGVSTTDSRIGGACGDDTGECSRGVFECIAGNVTCRNSQGPATEICNGNDDDCDGNTDETFPQLGLACGADLGECVRGNQQCVSGTLVCAGTVGAAAEACDGLDNDCDGRTDETDANNVPPLNVGRSCSAASGTLVFDPPAVQGECRLGTAMCTAGALKCVGEVVPHPELCDDLDQDCDGNNANGVAQTDPQVGASCGIDLGECRFGTYVCTGEELECENGALPRSEICNGRDDDCDGNYDETDSATQTPPVGAGEPCLINASGAVVHGSAAVVQGACVLGTSVCSGGSVGCPDYVGPTPELCDNIDQDCDGNPNNGVASTDARIGQPCPGNNNGVCSSGTTYCNSGTIACQGMIGQSAEICDGLDNDCDGLTSDDGIDEPTRGMTCGIDTGACVRGTMQCSSGSMVCLGQTAAAAEICDSTPGDPNNPNWDNDCDGMIDEDFQLQTNVNRCGACNVQCSFPNAIPRCMNGTCQIASCLPNYHDNPSQAGMDCQIGPCTIRGSEICNGIDDNCNGSVDEGLTAPTGVCNTVGACAGAVATCQGTSGWVCSKLPVTELCNMVDDNCNGQLNEGFNVGAPCTATGVGACATAGTLRCNAQGTGTFCSDTNGAPVVAGTASMTELCNGTDDDCDGTVDEPCPSGDSRCVTDAWISLGSGVEMYKYEASRPDSTAATTGSSSARSCSVIDRQPWTNVTYLQALAACRAADPNGRLCTEAEWEQACMNDPGGTCTWGFPNHPACNTYVGDQCNGIDYSSTPAIEASGRSGANDACYRGTIGTATTQIFELSGNVKEYVLQRSTGGIPVRGGATNNTRDGLRCDFDFSVWPDNSPFSNVGFRCCRSATPLAATCSTFEVTGQSITNATLAVSTLDVPLHGVITDLNVVNVRGTHNSMSQVDYMEVSGPDNTTVRLLNSNSSCNNTDDNWSFVFDTEAASALPAAGGGNPCGNSNTYRPAQALTAYNGKRAAGTWTFRVHDSSSSDAASSPRINSWGVRVCVNQAQ